MGAEKQEEMERWLRSVWQTEDSLTGSGFQNAPLLVNSRHPLRRSHLSVSLVFATPLQSDLQLVMTLVRLIDFPKVPPLAHSSYNCLLQGQWILAVVILCF